MLRRAAAQLATRSLLATDGSACSRAAAGAGASTSSSSSSFSNSASIFTAATRSSSSAAEWQTTIFRSSSSSSSQLFGSPRSFAADAAAQNEDEEGMASPKSQRVEKVVEEILQLNLIEVAELTEILQKRLGVSTMSFAAPMGGGGGFGGGSPAAGGAPAAAAAAPAEEKTEFDVKLDAVDGDARLKVIKEVRAATGLGLKEAKEVVERAPTVIKAGMKKEEAAELKAKLEAAGAKVSLE